MQSVLLVFCMHFLFIYLLVFHRAKWVSVVYCCTCRLTSCLQEVTLKFNWCKFGSIINLKSIKLSLIPFMGWDEACQMIENLMISLMDIIPLPQYKNIMWHTDAIVYTHENRKSHYRSSCLEKNKNIVAQNSYKVEKKKKLKHYVCVFVQSVISVYLEGM